MEKNKVPTDWADESMQEQGAEAGGDGIVGIHQLGLGGSQSRDHVKTPPGEQENKHKGQNFNTQPGDQVPVGDLASSKDFPCTERSKKREGNENRNREGVQVE